MKRQKRLKDAIPRTNLRTLPLLIALAFAPLAQEAAAQTVLKDETAIDSNSTTVSNTYLLNAGGDYAISYTTNDPAAPLDISTGSSGSGVTKIQVGDKSGTATSLTVTGGSVSNNVALKTDVVIVDTDGTLTTTGGSGSNAHSIQTGTLTQKGGSIVAAGDTGGSGIYATGLITQNAGTITAGDAASSGLPAIYAHGGIEQAGSGAASIVAVGGSGASSGGINLATGDLIQSNTDSGTIEATGGAGEMAYGISIGYSSNLIQNAGSGTAFITATGGSGKWAYGILLGGELQQTSTVATINAIGGSGDGATGVSASKTVLINGTLNATSEGKNATAMSVSNSGNAATALTFGANSTYTPRFSSTTANAVVSTSKGNIEIVSGATLKPYLTDTASSLGSGGSGTVTILNARNGSINGTFILDAPNSLVTYSAKNNGNGTYTVDWTYGDGGSTGGGSSLGPNTRALVGSFSSAVAASTNARTTAAINSLSDAIVNSSDPIATANQVQLTSTAHGTTRLTNASLTQLQGALAPLNNGVRLLANANTGVNGMMLAQSPLEQATRTDAGVATRPDKYMWLTPVYETGTRHAKTREYSKADEEFGGIAAGVAKTFGDTTVGGQLHYLHARLKSDGDAYYKANANTYGFTLMARQDRLLPTYDTGANSTWVQGNVGYSRENISQSRSDFIGQRHGSSPDADIWALGVSVGRDIAMPQARISPEFGFDYTHMSLDSYTEGNDNGYALKVNAKDYDSLRLKLGAEAEMPLANNWSIRGAAFYRYEAMDRNMRLDSAFAGAPSATFSTAGENLDRSSGDISIGLRYNVSELATLAADYTMRLEDSYTGHQFGLNFKMRF